MAWPGGGDKASASPATGGQHTTPATTPADTPLPSATTKLATGMLTPDGLRKGLRAIEDKTGRDTFGGLAAHPEYVAVKAMVPGNRTRYDSYTYLPGQGVEKGTTTGTLMGKIPVSLKNYRWDKLPALLTFAEQKLGVGKPASPQGKVLKVVPADG